MPFSPGSTDRLKKDLSGGASVVTPSDASYDTSRAVINKRFDFRPGLIVYCANAQDVARTLMFARDEDSSLRIRSGGCSPAGYSSEDGGVVLDVSRVSAVEIAGSEKSVTVGAGARWGQIYHEFRDSNLILPGGECPVVGVSGYALGGGLSLLGRTLGIGCDSVMEVELVNAEGKVLTCNAEQEPDLYWALRGGGGGNFGVVTSLTFQAYEMEPQVLCGMVTWPMDQAEDVLAEALPYFEDEAPRELDAIFYFMQHLEERALAVPMVYNGPPAEGQKHIDRLTSLGKPTKVDLKVSKFVDFLHDDFPTPPQSIHEYFKSGFIDKAPSRDALGIIVEGFRDFTTKNPEVENLLHIELTSGAVHDVAPDATAFVHRDQYGVLSVVANWMDKTNDYPQEFEWADNLHAALHESFSGQMYQNYPDPSAKDWRTAYYGANYERLTQVKHRYDPQNFFRFPQGLGAVADDSGDF